MQVFVEGVGLCGPGLAGWEASRAMLAGSQSFRSMPVVVPPSALLPANERRRMVSTVKLTMAVGSEALFHAGRDPTATATVFTSSGGDGETVNGILEALALPERDVSPTRFHNSVHNAPAGYWSIATHSREPTTALCGHDISFAAGLLEAAAQATVDSRAIALIAYDLPYPEPLNSVRTILALFGAALVLSPEESEHSLARLTIELKRGTSKPTVMAEPGLEEIRQGVPAARSLPLLAALARGSAETVTIDHRGDKHLAVAVAPLSHARHA
jgi:hypothetical protein